MNTLNNILLLAICLCGTVIANGQSWVDDKINSMSTKEKVGQLFMIRAHSNLGKDHEQQVAKYIKDYKVGGLCFFQGTPEKQADLTNQYQEDSDTPLLIAIDAEWGLGMRFPGLVMNFPRQLMLGAITHDNTIYDMGVEVAKQLKRIGIHMNFGPVIDVNNNPNNPVINDRSFGEDVYKVSTKGYQYMKGMQDNGVLACAKHFPGHGDTDTDSHHDLPVIAHDRARLDSIELKPFQLLADQGIASVMVAHVHMPALDSRPHRPTTLSKAVIEDLLLGDLGYKGLVITDAMEMKGVSDHFPNGIAEVEAVLAGNDIILLPNDLPKAYDAVVDAVEKGQISMARLDRSVHKILSAKMELNLHLNTPKISNSKNALRDINSKQAQDLKESLIKDALTLAAYDGHIIPARKNRYPKITCLGLGANKNNAFHSKMKQQNNCKTLINDKVVTRAKRVEIIKALRDQDLVLVSLHDMSKYASKGFGITETSIELIHSIAKEKKILLTLFGSPYALRYFEDIPNILVAYNEEPMTQEAAALALLGHTDIRGSLPVTATPKYKAGIGHETYTQAGLGYAEPEDVDMSSDTLKQIDKIVEEMIRTKAAPGCQILIAKEGKIIFHKAYGHHTYDRRVKTKVDDVFDLASLTKTMATTLSVMRLQDEKKISIYQPFVNYLPEIDTSNKANLIIRDVMAHHSGMPGWIPFYKNTVEIEKKKTKILPKYYRQERSDSFSIQVIDNMYLRSDFRDSIWSRILACKLRDRRDYRYSDLGFYALEHVIERMTGQNLNDYCRNTFYDPLGLKNTCFNPLNTIDKNRIPPTERDNYFRNSVVKGYVHDMGAAMLGGYSGHAGLFSNSYEIAILMQMLLNGGSYSGKQYITPQTVNLFTTRYYRSTRRGIGFDMKETNDSKRMNMSEKAPISTFGHLGFTGTAAFADPDNEIIYIFLSNRTYPSMSNNKFSKNNYRQKVHTVIYKSLEKNKV